ncbi:lipopolysaccharide assembly protein LapA domain-containing protein [Reyranella sp.]|uniref:lipopolysaccharide assembly protein LapA domain-containing protein n=1 Tax=Reyranella sp. TaxID=1929291 RepID=UPI003BACD42D
MKILVRVLFVLFLLIGVLIAVSNNQPVQLSLWPLPHLVVMPLYLLVIGMLLLGVLAGLGMGWWAGRHHRRRARAARGEANRLAREVQRLRDTTPAAAPAPVAPAPREAIQRQAELVAPELAAPRASGRGPFS